MPPTERHKQHPPKISAYRASAATGLREQAASFEAEYRKMLAYRSLADLQTIAKARGIDPLDDRSSLIDILARQLSDPAATRAEVLRSDPPSQAILAYLHVTLAPGHALSAGNLLRELSAIYEDGSITWLQRDTGHRQIIPAIHESANSSSEWDVNLDSPVRSAVSAPAGVRLDFRQVYAQIAQLTQRGLLLCVKQNNAMYYSLPSVVRASLPVLSALVPLCAADKIASLQIQTRTPAALIQSLFDVWQAIHTSTGKRDAYQGSDSHAEADAAVSALPFVRSDAPPRQPAEDEWPHFQGWNHVPSEVEGLARVQQWYVRPGIYGERRALLNLPNQSVTIPAAVYRLRRADRAFLRRKTGCSDEEIEFYCALLEEIGALSTQPGQPIVTHPSAIQHLLSLSVAEQIATLGQAWLNMITWSEMDILLRSQGRPEGDDKTASPAESLLRLRRSLNHTDYKPADLYQEWRAGRQAVLRLLSVMEEGPWFSTIGFLHTLFQINPNLFHSSSAASVWWLESTRTRKQFGTTFDDWQQGYGQCLLAMVRGPLAWLGIVSLGTIDGQPEALRLTQVGQFLVGRQPALRDESDLASPGDMCIFGDDMTISVVPNRIPIQLHHLLGSIGLLEQVTPQRFVYRLTAEGLRQWQEMPLATEARASTSTQAVARVPLATEARASTSTQAVARVPLATETRASTSTQAVASAPLDTEPLPVVREETRMHPSSLISLLRQHLQAIDPRIDVPAIWQDTLSRWSQNYGQLHVYEGITVIELADEYALQELLASTSLREHMVYQFSSRLIAIRPDRIEDLVREMEGRGYTPRIR